MYCVFYRENNFDKLVFLEMNFYIYIHIADCTEEHDVHSPAESGTKVKGIA